MNMNSVIADRCWKHVALDRGVLTVAESAQRVSAGRVEFLPPKSASGFRGVALDRTTITALREHRARQATHILELGGAYDDQDLAFAGPLREPLDPDRLTREWRSAANRAGHPGVRLHDLRHAHATALMAAGVHPTIIQDRLGHASASFTMDRYEHVSAQTQMAPVEALDDDCALG